MKTNQMNFRTNLWNLVRPYWSSSEKWLALGMLTLVILAEVAQVQMAVFINNWQKNFYDAVQVFNTKLLIHYLWQYLGLVALFCLIVGYSAYIGGLLVNRWRRWLTQHYLDKWLLQKNYYALNLLGMQVDNPDQRISDDLNEFPALTFALFTGLLGSVLTLISFSLILWNLSGIFRLPVINMVIPGFMFWGAMLFAGVGTWLTFIIGRKLPHLNYQQERYNADFRFRLIRIREAAEQIAFYQGEPAEEQRLKNSFSFIFNNTLKIISVQRNLTFFTTAYLNFSRLAGTLIALPRYIVQRLQMGILIQCSSAFQSVNEALSFIIYSYRNIANWHAVINRLVEFDQHMQEAAAANKQPRIVKANHAAPALVVKQLTLTLPNAQSLLSYIDLTINAGDKVLIQGASGIGKSTLLRAIAGLWPYGSGEILFPDAKKMIFSPQKPYLPLGSLRDVLTYPNVHNPVTDAALRQALEQGNLAHLIAKLDVTDNWSQILSLGEQQRIAFARLLLHRPDWALLDEATSALDEQNELNLYQLLLSNLPDLTLVSVGHRSSLKAIHSKIVQLEDYQ